MVLSFSGVAVAVGVKMVRGWRTNAAVISGPGCIYGGRGKEGKGTVLGSLKREHEMFMLSIYYDMHLVKRKFS